MQVKGHQVKFDFFGQTDKILKTCTGALFSNCIVIHPILVLIFLLEYQAQVIAILKMTGANCYQIWKIEIFQNVWNHNQIFGDDLTIPSPQRLTNDQYFFTIHSFLSKKYGNMISPWVNRKQCTRWGPRKTLLLQYYTNWTIAGWKIVSLYYDLLDSSYYVTSWGPIGCNIFC